MSSRLIQAALISAAFGLTASAQIRSSGLDDVNAWNASLLERGESSVSDRIWASSDTGYLIDLMGSLDIEALTRAERELLSLALRSPSAAPRGDGADKLQTERLRVLDALGERRAVAMLGRQIDEVPEGIDPDAITADNRLAAGELGLVCDQMNPEAAEKFWLELRIICALENDNLAEAELALELAGTEEGADPWVTETAISIIAEADERPDSRFGSGLEVALSQLADLDVTAEALATARGDLAADYASERSNPLELRFVAARNAMAAGLLDAPQYRSLYLDYVGTPDFEPQTPTDEALYLLTQVEEPRGPIIRDLRADGIDALDEMFPDDEVAEDEPPELSLDERRLEALVAALGEARGDADRYRTVTGLFEEDIKSFSADAVSEARAMAFARAALAQQNALLTTFWLDAAEDSGDASSEIDLMRGYTLILSRERDRGTIEGVVAALLDEDADEGANEAALKLFSVWTSFDVSLPVEARRALAEASSGEDSAATPGRLVAIDAAARNGAHGEAILLILNMTAGSPGQLSPIALQTALSTLRRLGADDTARALALEIAGLG